MNEPNNFLAASTRGLARGEEDQPAYDQDACTSSSNFLACRPASARTVGRRRIGPKSTVHHLRWCGVGHTNSIAVRVVLGMCPWRARSRKTTFGKSVPMLLHNRNVVRLSLHCLLAPTTKLRHAQSLQPRATEEKSNVVA